MMRKAMMLMIVVAASGISFLIPSPSAAATSSDITVTVTITHLSVAVADAAVSLGLVDTSSETVSSPAEIITNDGNVAETYTLQLTTTDVMTVGETETAAGADTSVLQALFTGSGGTAPISGDFGADAGTDDDVVKSTVPQSASATVYGFSTGTGTGASVPAAGVRDLYFKYSAPTSVTSGAQEDLVVTLTATAG